MFLNLFLKYYIYYFSFRLAQSVKLMIAIAIFFTFTLQFYVPVSIIWKGMEHKIRPEQRNITEYALRVGLVVCIFNRILYILAVYLRMY